MISIRVLLLPLRLVYCHYLYDNSCFFKKVFLFANGRITNARARVCFDVLAGLQYLPLMTRAAHVRQLSTTGSYKSYHNPRRPPEPVPFPWSYT